MWPSNIPFAEKRTAKASLLIATHFSIGVLVDRDGHATFNATGLEASVAADIMHVTFTKTGEPQWRGSRQGNTAVCGAARHRSASTRGKPTLCPVPVAAETV